MSAIPQATYISEEEYRIREESSLMRHEWFRGRVHKFEVSSFNHSTLCSNICYSAHTALRDSRYQALSGMMRIRVATSGLYTYPDAVIFHSPGRFTDDKTTLLTPKVLFEVLSASTEKYDRGGKFEQYQKIETLTDYVLIAQDYIHVEHFQRTEAGWLHRAYIRRSDSLVLENVDIELPLDEIYDELELSELLIAPDTDDED